MENGRHKVFNFQMSKLDAMIINEKLGEVFNNLDSAAKKNKIALGFVLRNVKTGEYRNCHENNTLFKKLLLLCTKSDLITIQGKAENLDIVEQCTQECQNRKWRFILITNVTIFAALLKNIPMGCPDLSCLNYLCLFRALTMYLHGHSNLDAHTSQLFTEFLSKSGYDPKDFRGVSVDDLPLAEEIVERNIFIYDFGIQEGEYVEEIARRKIGKFKKTVKLLRFNNHMIHTNDIDSFLKCFQCPSSDCFFNRSDNFNRHLMTFKDRVRHIYQRMYIHFEKCYLKSWKNPISQFRKITHYSTTLRF